MSTHAASRASFAAFRFPRARFSPDLTATTEIPSAAAISAYLSPSMCIRRAERCWSGSRPMSVTRRRKVSRCSASTAGSR